MYYAKVNWFNTDHEEDCLSFMLIPAADWNDAMQKITNEFDWINSIEMKEVDSAECDLVFIPEDLVDRMIEENMPK